MPALATVLPVIGESGALDEGVFVLTPRKVRLELSESVEQLVGFRKFLRSVVSEETLSDVSNVEVAVD